MAEHQSIQGVGNIWYEGFRYPLAGKLSILIAYLQLNADGSVQRKPCLLTNSWY